jgi:hypothetical protein
MSENERPSPRLGPFENLALTYCGGLDALFKSYEPALRGIARVNSELLALGARRALAWLDIPVSLTRCNTPPDVFSLHVKFWQIAMEHYAQGSQRLGAALSACVVVPGMTAAQRGGNSALPVRDYMTFSEPEADPVENGEPAHGKRRAA